MSDAVGLLQAVVEAGAACCVGLLAGLALAREHTALLRLYGPHTTDVPYWSLVRGGFWVSQYVGWCFLAWVFLEGAAYIEMGAAAVGLLAGIVIGLAATTRSRDFLIILAAGLALLGVDYILEFAMLRFDPHLLGPAAWGLAISAAAGGIAGLIWLLSKLLRRESPTWAFRIAAFGSLLLVSGGPFLWMTLVGGIAFGYSCSARYVPPRSTDTLGKLLAQGLGAIAIGHALFNLYFYEISSYGIFWHPAVAVAPYALGATAIGFCAHRVGLGATSRRAAQAVA